MKRHKRQMEAFEEAAAWKVVGQFDAVAASLARQMAA
jgi:hypothetical protein